MDNIGLTVEEHNILIENNKMLKQLTGCIKSKDNVTSEEFIANIIANLISNKMDSNFK